jgi:hypothetical protein
VRFIANLVVGGLLVFLSSREKNAQPKIKMPTPLFGFGYLSTVISDLTCPTMIQGVVGSSHNGCSLLSLDLFYLIVCSTVGENFKSKHGRSFVGGTLNMIFSITTIWIYTGLYVCTIDGLSYQVKLSMICNV